MSLIQSKTRVLAENVKSKKQVDRKYNILCTSALDFDHFWVRLSVLSRGILAVVCFLCGIGPKSIWTAQVTIQ